MSGKLLIEVEYPVEELERLLTRVEKSVDQSRSAPVEPASGSAGVWRSLNDNAA